jgi:GT2 family glycosyltransferase
MLTARTEGGEGTAVRTPSWLNRLWERAKPHLPPGWRLACGRLLGRVPRPAIRRSAFLSWCRSRTTLSAFPDGDRIIHPDLGPAPSGSAHDPIRPSDPGADGTGAAEAPSASSSTGGGKPAASIVLVTHNALAHTRLCIQSLVRNTHVPAWEALVVDNGSTDGTAAWLRDTAAQHHWLRVIPNAENRGFAAACNQGLHEARGEAFVLLNNDTLVPPDWLPRLLRPLEDPSAGLVCPSTNGAANEARIGVPYRTWAEMEAFAAWCHLTYGDQVEPLAMVPMFCAALTRTTFGRVGNLDERFRLGMFEDDDYSRRAQSCGLELLCARGAFVHHFQIASFDALRQNGAYHRIYAENQCRFEEKWGAPTTKP